MSKKFEYDYIRRADIKELKAVINNKLTSIEPSNILSGLYVKKIGNKIVTKKTSVSTKSKVSDASAIRERILSIADAYEEGLSKRFGKFIKTSDIDAFLKADCTEDMIVAFYCGVRSVIHFKGDVEMSEVDGIFVFRTDGDFIQQTIQNAINNAKKKTFEIGMKYPQFNWSVLGEAKATLINSKSKTDDKMLMYKVFVMKPKTGYTLVAGKWVGELKGASFYPRSGYDVDEVERNDGYLGIVSSNGKQLFETLKALASQKDSYVKEIDWLYNNLGGVEASDLKSAKIKFKTGGNLDKPIEKMTKIELMNFVQKIDPLKFNKMNWFKGATVQGLRVQVRTWYDREHSSKHKTGGSISAISDIPNLTEEIEAGRVTYRGAKNGTLIRVKDKEYFISSDDYRKLEWDEANSRWKNRIKFAAPKRKFNRGGGVEADELELFIRSQFYPGKNRMIIENIMLSRLRARGYVIYSKHPNAKYWAQNEQDSLRLLDFTLYASKSNTNNYQEQDLRLSYWVDMKLKDASLEDVVEKITKSHLGKIYDDGDEIISARFFLNDTDDISVKKYIDELSNIKGVNVTKFYLADNATGNTLKVFKNNELISFVDLSKKGEEYSKGGGIDEDYVFVGNTMMNGEYKPVYKKDNKYYLKYYNPIKYDFLADEKDIKNYRIGRSTDTYAKGGGVEADKKSQDYRETEYKAAWDKLVPDSGAANTLEGQLLIAISRIIRRYFNDGDRWWNMQTPAGECVAYLVTAPEVPAMMRYYFAQKLKESYKKSRSSYVAPLNEMMDAVLDRIKNGKITQLEDPKPVYSSEYNNEENRRKVFRLIEGKMSARVYTEDAAKANLGMLVAAKELTPKTAAALDEKMAEKAARPSLWERMNRTSDDATKMMRGGSVVFSSKYDLYEYNVREKNDVFYITDKSGVFKNDEKTFKSITEASNYAVDKIRNMIEQSTYRDDVLVSPL